MSLPFLTTDIIQAATVPTIKKFVFMTIQLGRYATAIYRTVFGLTPPDGITYGRFYESGDPLLQYSEHATSVDDLIAQGVALRKDLAITLKALLEVAQTGDIPNDLPDAVAAVFAALMNACATPVDQIFLMEILASFVPPPIPTGTDVAGQDIGNFAAMVARLIRCDALINLGLGTAAYVPDSSTNAMDIRNTAAGLIQAESIRLASTYDDIDYTALQAVRTAVVGDMNSRANTLNPVITKTFGTNLPALVIAQQLYGDASRTDELVGRNNGMTHPGFCPIMVEALAT